MAARLGLAGLVLVRLSLAELTATPITETGTCHPISLDGKLCQFQCEGPTLHRFDFQPLVTQAGAAGFLHAVGTIGNQNYYWGACGQAGNLGCEGSMTTSAPVAIQAWGGNPPTFPQGECEVLGIVTPRKCSLEMAPAGPGMLCNYTGGSDGRTVGVRYVCDNTFPKGAPSHLQADPTSPQALSYVLTVTGPAACGVVYTPPLSWGTITLIIFSSALVVYIGGGFLINVKIRERRPTMEESFPNYHAWAELPGLVKDGCLFTKEMAIKAYYTHIAKSGPPLDPSLSRRLAEDDGGADDRT